MTFTLGPEIGADYVKPRNATDAQHQRALEVIVQGMVLEKKLEGTRQEEKMEGLMESDKFEGIISCMPQDHKAVRTWLNARVNAREQLEEERRASTRRHRQWSSRRRTYLRCH